MCCFLFIPLDLLLTRSIINVKSGALSQTCKCPQMSTNEPNNFLLSKLTAGFWSFSSNSSNSDSRNQKSPTFKLRHLVIRAKHKSTLDAQSAGNKMWILTNEGAYQFPFSFKANSSMHFFSPQAVKYEYNWSIIYGWIK